MTSPQNTLLKFKNIIDNTDNNSYRSIRKITPEEAGLDNASIQKFLLKFKKKTSKNIESKKPLGSEIKPDIVYEEKDNTTKDNTNTKYGKVLSYTETRELFKNINALKRKHFLEDRHQKIMEWYYDNRYSVNVLFKETMFYMIEEDLEFLLSNKALYNNFVEYCYDNYMKFHI